jgi:uncharacterized membrane protein
MALPLVAALVVGLQSPALVRAGFAYYLLAFYMLNLGVETGLAVLRTRPVSEA